MQAQGGPSRARALGRGTAEVQVSEQNPGWPAGGLQAKTRLEIKNRLPERSLGSAHLSPPPHPPLKFGIISV